MHQYLPKSAKYNQHHPAGHARRYECRQSAGKMPIKCRQIVYDRKSADKMPDTEQGQGLHYSNMYAVCSGNRGRRHTRKTSDYACDAIQSWIYAGLIWSGAFGCLIAALNFRNADKDEPDKK